jgi:death-on-curing protein
MAIRFLTVRSVIRIHDDQIRQYGGGSGILHRDLLESAVAAPRSTFRGQLLHPTLAEMAGAYLFHLVSNHSFVDGNKRVGASAAITFLRLNGSNLIATEDQLVELTLKVASGTMPKSEVLEFFKQHVR